MRVAFDPNLRLQDVLLGFAEVDAQLNVSIKGIALNTRSLHEGGLFVAVKGHQQHGLSYLQEAVDRGAAAVVYELEGAMEYHEVLSQVLESGIPAVAVEGLSQKVSTMAGRVYGHPSRFTRVIGVTGTDGKTSVTNFIAQMLVHQGRKAAMIGTLGAGVFPQLHSTGHTTPDAVSMQRLLRDFVDLHVDDAVMEVSSHALDQGRVEDLAFDMGVFTNLSHDHLDYHGTMQAYQEAKARLFHMPGLRRAVINLDDPVGRQLVEQISDEVEVVTYSRLGHKDADYVASNICPGVEGIKFTLGSPKGSREVQLPLVGLFNLDNALAAAAVVSTVMPKISELVEALQALQPVEGRMELIQSKTKPTVVIDYAHTPNALETALKAVRVHAQEQVFCVFGCGGDRDAAKRPAMGKVAEQLADQTWVTDDNPRGESPEAIVKDILAGMAMPQAANVEHDRQKAISAAISAANADDWVLVAGKGHETTQTYGSDVRRFSDHQAVVKALEEIR